jgi:hypothetical protein
LSFRVYGNMMDRIIDSPLIFRILSFTHELSRRVPQRALYPPVLIVHVNNATFAIPRDISQII